MKTILVVDDDPSVTASLALLLKQSGYGVRTASGAAEGRAVVDGGGVDLVLQDMNFSRQTGGEEGLALLRELKARWPAMPVVLMTAWGSIPLAVEGMRAGAADFVTKPWTNASRTMSSATARRRGAGCVLRPSSKRSSNSIAVSRPAIHHCRPAGSGRAHGLTKLE